jgi:O-antigen ligase
VAPRALTKSLRPRRRSLAPDGAGWHLNDRLPTASIARVLVALGAALLFLSSAATIELFYTVVPSQLLIGAAMIIGAPFVWRGWVRLGDIRWWALGILVAYMIATIAGETAVLPGETRGGGYRAFVYLSDLVVGLAAVGLIAALWRRPAQIRILVMAFVVGAVAAAAYGLYQWPAQRYGWPFNDVNNTLDSSGVTRGASQGNALLGWERIRGTFVEPHFLAAYLASVLPLCIGLVYVVRGISRYLAFVGSILIAMAIVLTASIPGIAALAIGGFMGLAIYSVAKGRALLAQAMGGIMILVCALGILLFTSPGLIAPVTGREEGQIAYTMDFREDTWSRAIDLWARRPVTGYGPGQSSVQLAWENSIQESSGAPRVLGSPQGLWAASLIDGGVIAFGFWVAFLGAVVFYGSRFVLRHPDPLALSLFIATSTALVSSEISGARLDLRVWLLIGALLAVAGEAAQGDRSGSDEEPKASAG